MSDRALFEIKYSFFDESHETELSMFVNGSNLLAFKRNGREFTTRWNLDELTSWLREFIDNMTEDPYPVEVEGAFAANKDINAREFDTDDEEEFNAYYDALDDWNLRHRWHPASSGAILADVYFQLVEDYVEISWNNQDSEEGVVFHNLIGGVRIPKDIFYTTVDSFLKEYADHWFC